MSFAIFINDLRSDLKQADAGVTIGGESLDLLMYADSVVMKAPTLEKAQLLLDVMNKWCFTNRSNTELKCGEKLLDYVSHYKYLGYIINESLKHKTTVDLLVVRLGE